MLRFHLDEHVPFALATGLRRHGIDVTTSADAGLLNADDDAQLAFATAQRRVLVTHDHDFLRLHAGGTTHSGIAYCHQNKHSVGEVMRHDLDAITIAPDADALQALGEMRRTGSGRLLVAEGDHLVGILSLKDLLSFLHLKIELEGNARGAHEGGVATRPTERRDTNADPLS